MSTVYDFTVKDRAGSDVSLRDYEGKVLLIVNTATGCGFTPHYDPLEEMYKEYKDQGFEILDFPQFAKIDVNGETADPLFAWLASEKPFNGFGKGVKNAMLSKFAKANNKIYGDKTYIGWNFTKFLIARDGTVLERFEPTDDMDDVKKAVAAAL